MGTPFFAEIRIVSFNFAPRGWALCNGQLLPINQNQGLFSLMGTTYGGDGIRNFALPDFRSRVAVHQGNGITIGQRGGEESHTVTVNELPQHGHGVNVHSINPPNADQIVPLGRVLGSSAGNLYTSGAPSVSLNAASIANSNGGSQAHSNIQPYLVLNFIVALQGIFPSQN